MSGSVDGIAGRGTTQAAASFARAQGLLVPAIQTGSLSALEAFVIKAEEALADKEAEARAEAERQRQADAEATKRREADAADRAGNAAYNAKNYAEARQLYTKACDGGNMSGCNNLGYMYRQALGVTQDYTRARQLYTKACDGGELSLIHI